ncbi:DUF4157 domain-containing protein [Draconibacterium sp.]|nr:DUF4157 domain-containing protein [Draconibacterium sp.]
MAFGGIQTKLTIGQPNDKYEQEADRVADQVMRMPEPPQIQRTCSSCQDEEIQTKPLFPTITPLIQRQPEEEEEPAQAKLLIQRQPEKEEEPVQAKSKLQPQPEEEEEPARAKPLVQKQPEEEEEPVMPKSNNGKPQEATSTVEAGINQNKWQGTSLPSSTRAFMENRFGTDFSGVRIHNDSNAIQLNRQLNAQAFTKGSDIYFNSGKYNPESSSGKHLLAHELTHVVQQSGGGIGDGQLVQREPVLNVTAGTTGELESELQRLIRERSLHCIDPRDGLTIRECTLYNSLIRTLRIRIRNRGNPNIEDCPISLFFDGSNLSMNGVSFPAVSGRPINDRFDYSPMRQRMEGVGPIPEGTYWLNPLELTNLWYCVGRAARAWGTHRITIHPFHSTHTFGRGGFFIHGGTIPGSAGCIDLTNNMSSFVDEVNRFTGAELQRTSTMPNCKIILNVNYPSEPGDYPLPAGVRTT